MGNPSNDQFVVNLEKNFDFADNEPTYGFNFMFNPLTTMEPSSPTLGNDKGSDTSSGIHSNSSNSSVGLDKTKSNSLESLMQTLQKLEAAAADKPNLRSLSSLQRSINILNTMDNTVEQKPSHVKVTSFAAENSIYGTRMNCAADQSQSKLIEFTQNPDYSKYFMPPSTCQ